MQSTFKKSDRETVSGDQPLHAMLEVLLVPRANEPHENDIHLNIVGCENCLVHALADMIRKHKPFAALISRAAMISMNLERPIDAFRPSDN